MTDYPPLSTRVIGETESALGALLAPLLAEAGLTFPQWVVLTITAAGGTGGPGVAREQLIAEVAKARKIDPADVAAAVSDLAAAGALAADGGRLTLTGAGQGRFTGVRGRVADITSQLFDFPAEDLAAAGRVLGTITARANAVLAGAAR
jgi:hypothetical protein